MRRIIHARRSNLATIKISRRERKILEAAAVSKEKLRCKILNVVYYTQATDKFKQGNHAARSRVTPIPSKTRYVLKTSRRAYAAAKFKMNRSYRKILKASRCAQIN